MTLNKRTLELANRILESAEFTCTDEYKSDVKFAIITTLVETYVKARDDEIQKKLYDEACNLWNLSEGWKE